MNVPSNARSSCGNKDRARRNFHGCVLNAAQNARQIRDAVTGTCVARDGPPSL